LLLNSTASLKERVGDKASALSVYINAVRFEPQNIVVIKKAIAIAQEIGIFMIDEDHCDEINGYFEFLTKSECVL
jgi:hypothetical protein